MKYRTRRQQRRINELCYLGRVLAYMVGAGGAAAISYPFLKIGGLL